jgi:AAA domain
VTDSPAPPDGDDAAYDDEQYLARADVRAELRRLKDPFREADDMPLGLLFKQYSGEKLTPDEKKELERVERAREKRELLGIVDLAEVMREGVTAPGMLVENMLVRGEHHLWYGTKEASKTWFALHAAAQLLARREVVVWVDKEMGKQGLAERFEVLGVSPEDVDESFVYMEFPTLDGSADSREAWKLILAAFEPALVIVDAQTEVLADADLNENSGTDVAKWEKWYLLPARKRGATTLLLDHTGHAEGGRAVSSRQKGAAAKVELEFVKRAAFDRETVGHVEVTCNKNTRSAPIPKTQHFRIGGTESGFVLDATELPPHPDANGAGDGSAATYFRIRQAVEATIKKYGADGLSTTQLRGMVEGSNATIAKVVKGLVAAEDSPVAVRPGPKPGSLLYYWEES